MLTTDYWAFIMNNHNINESVMQVLDIQMISHNDNERYRLHLSDGCNSYSFVMLASQLNDMVLTSILSKFAIVWVTEFIISELTPGFSEKSTKIVVLVDLVVLVSGALVGSIIGDPKPIINSENLSDPLAIQIENILLQLFDIFH